MNVLFCEQFFPHAYQFSSVFSIFSDLLLHTVYRKELKIRWFTMIQ